MRILVNTEYKELKGKEVNEYVAVMIADGGWSQAEALQFLEGKVVTRSSKNPDGPGEVVSMFQLQNDQKPQLILA